MLDCREELEGEYAEMLTRVGSLLDGEDDFVSAMATVACELHHAFEHYNWTGFYRSDGKSMLLVGPYQGSHGCLRIPFGKGVCGVAASSKVTQFVSDVHSFPGHIACSSSTNSEIVVPVVTKDNVLLAVLDVDSDAKDAFSEADRRALEAVCNLLAGTAWSSGLLF